MLRVAAHLTMKKKMAGVFHQQFAGHQTQSF